MPAEVWVDALDRDALDAVRPLLLGGAVRGAAWNPLGLAGGVGRSTAYLSDLRRLVSRGDDAATIARTLAVSDIRSFLDSPGDAPRLASLPVPPRFARDRAGLIAEAERLAHLIGDPRGLIALPATIEAMPAIESLAAAGVGLHVTLILSVDAARRVSRAFVRGVRSRLDAGEPIEDVTLVAGIPIAPIADTLPAAALAGHLRAIAESVLSAFQGPDWDALAARGAMPGRIAWTAIPPGTVLPAMPAIVIVPHDDAQTMFAQEPDPANAACDDRVERLAPTMLERALAGVASAHDALIEELEARREEIEREATTPGQSGRLGPHEDAIHDALDAMERDGAVRRFAREARPGWLDVVERMRPHAGDLAAFADEVAEERFAHILMIGGPAATAGPEVFRRTNIPMWGHPELLVLHSPCPTTVRRFSAAIDPVRTLLVVAEPDEDSPVVSALLAHFRDRLGAGAEGRMVAIARAGGTLEGEARRDGFRRVFVNPPGVDDQHSALAFTGLVPAALMGLDVATLLDRAATAVDACRPWTPIEQNPAATLAATLSALVARGRDKLTLIDPAPIEAFGPWVERLVLRDDGGSAIVPVAGESLGSPAVYGADRVFVQVRTVDGRDTPADAALDALADAGHPVVTHVLGDTLDLAAEFFRFQVALALAESRLAAVAPPAMPLHLPEPRPLAAHAGMVLSAIDGDEEAGEGDRARFVAIVRDRLARVRPGGTVAISAYFDEREVREVDLGLIRAALRDVLRVAVTTGHGPAYSGSTGRGAGDGLTIQLTADEGDDLPVPGRPFGYAAIHEAQALGALARLASAGRPAIRVHLGADADRGLAALRDVLADALVTPPRRSPAAGAGPAA